MNGLIEKLKKEVAYSSQKDVETNKTSWTYQQGILLSIDEVNEIIAALQPTKKIKQAHKNDMTWEQFEGECAKILKSHPLHKATKSDLRLLKSAWRSGLNPKVSMGLVLM